MYFVYVIYSEKLHQYYCGQSGNINFRLQQHNDGETFSNKHGIPWTMIGYLEVLTRAEAMMLERKIKKRGIGRWLQEHKDKLIKEIT
jgi:putative endonuclease